MYDKVEIMKTLMILSKILDFPFSWREEPEPKRLRLSDLFEELEPKRLQAFWWGLHSPGNYRPPLTPITKSPSCNTITTQAVQRYYTLRAGKVKRFPCEVYFHLMEVILLERVPLKSRVKSCSW